MFEYKHWLKDPLSQKAMAEIERLHEVNKAMRLALEAYDRVHTRLFGVGFPLQQNGVDIDHRDLNEAHRLACAALAAANAKKEPA